MSKKHSTLAARLLAMTHSERRQKTQFSNLPLREATIEICLLVEKGMPLSKANDLDDQ